MQKQVEIYRGIIDTTKKSNKGIIFWKKLLYSKNYYTKTSSKTTSLIKVLQNQHFSLSVETVLICLTFSELC